MGEGEGVAADHGRGLGGAVADGEQAEADAVDDDVVLEDHGVTAELDGAGAAVGEAAVADGDALAAQAHQRAVPVGGALQAALLVVVVAPGPVEEQPVQDEAVVAADALEHVRLVRDAQAGLRREDRRCLPGGTAGEVGAVSAEHGQLGGVDDPRGALATPGIGARRDVDAVAGRSLPQREPRVVERPGPGAVADRAARRDEEVGHDFFTSSSASSVLSASSLKPTLTASLTCANAARPACL